MNDKLIYVYYSAKQAEYYSNTNKAGGTYNNFTKNHECWKVNYVPINGVKVKYTEISDTPIDVTSNWGDYVLLGIIPTHTHIIHTNENW